MMVVFIFACTSQAENPQVFFERYDLFINFLKKLKKDFNAELIFF
jgi:hypothetical protein